MGIEAEALVAASGFNNHAMGQQDRWSVDATHRASSLARLGGDIFGCDGRVCILIENPLLMDAWTHEDTHAITHTRRRRSAARVDA